LPRRKKDESEENKSSEEKKPKKSANKKKNEKYVDPDKLLDEYLDELVNLLGLSYLNFSREEYKEILKEPFASAVGEVKSKPKLSTILNRLRAMGDNLMEIIAYKILRIKDLEKLSDDQLEFVTNYTRQGIIQLADRLYRELIRRNKKDLIDILRNNWTLYSNGFRSPIKCPRCGFESVMPDLSCKVCGYTLSMRELKNTINVMSTLQDYIKFDKEGFSEILKSGFFYYTSEGPVPPSKFKPAQGLIYYEVILNKEEKQKLESISHNVLPGS